MIKSLSNTISNSVLHKLLIEKTNKPESKDFLEAEFDEYRNISKKKFLKYHWNQEDINKTKSQSFSQLLIKINQRPDIQISRERAKEEIGKLIDELIEKDEV